jgi:hypothetical protein
MNYVKLDSKLQLSRTGTQGVLMQGGPALFLDIGVRSPRYPVSKLAWTLRG